MAVGLLEAFGLIEEYGRKAMDAGILSMDDIIFVSKAKKKKGCKTISPTILADERKRVMELGQLVKRWRDS